MLPLHSTPNIDVKKLLRNFKMKKKEWYGKYILNVERYFYCKPFT